MAWVSTGAPKAPDTHDDNEDEGASLVPFRECPNGEAC